MPGEFPSPDTSPGRPLPPVTVLLAHRHPTLRTALRMLLEGTGDIRVLAETDGAGRTGAGRTGARQDGDGQDGTEPGREVQVEVWDAAALRIADRRSGSAVRPRVLVLVGDDDVDDIDLVLRSDVDGCVLTTDPPAALADAVRALARGDAWLSPPVARRVLDHCRAATERSGPRLEGRVSALSEREREVLLLLAAGQSNAEIAAVLTLSAATVKTHVSRILGKLEVRDRVQATAVAHRAGLLHIEP